MAKGSDRRSLFSDFGWALLPFIFLLGFWVLLRESGLINPTLLPSPQSVLKVFWTNLTEGELLANIRMSVQRVATRILASNRHSTRANTVEYHSAWLVW